MDNKIDFLGMGFIVFILIMGLVAIAYNANKRGDFITQQSDNLEKICLKAYKTDLKNDNEIKELCKNVKVRLFE